MVTQACNGEKFCKKKTSKIHLCCKRVIRDTAHPDIGSSIIHLSNKQRECTANRGISDAVHLAGGIKKRPAVLNDNGIVKDACKINEPSQHLLNYYVIISAS